MACDMSVPCKFPSLDSCQNGFLWTHLEVDLAPHPLVDLVLQGGDAEKFPQALGFESLDSFSSFFPPESASRVHILHPWRRGKIAGDLHNLNFISKLTMLLRQILFNLAIAGDAEAEEVD